MKMGFHLNLILFGLSTLLCVMCNPQSFPCGTSKDPIYQGVYLACSYRKLSSHDVTQLRHPNVTWIILSFNPIKTFPAFFLAHFRDLRRLECEWCELESLNEDAFGGLQKLEVLKLGHNRLRLLEGAFPKGLFRHTPEIRELETNDNSNAGQIESYSDYIDIFYSLVQLRVLKIDGFTDLRIGEEFSKLTMLKELWIDCHYLVSMSNHSLIGLRDSGIEYLRLERGKLFEPNIGFDAFSNLPINISSLVLSNLQMGNINAMKMMIPLSGRNIDNIRLIDIGMHYSMGLKKLGEDGIVDSKHLASLLNICVNHFEWSRSNIFVFDFAQSSGVWPTCIESLIIWCPDYSTIFGNILYMYALRLHNLRSLVVSNGRLDELVKDQEEKYDQDKFLSTSISEVAARNRVWTKIKVGGILQSRKHTNDSNLYVKKQHHGHAKRHTKSSFMLALPPSIETLTLDIYYTINIVQDVTFFPNKLKHFNLRFGHLNVDNGKICGLDHLESLDFTNATIRTKDNFIGNAPRLKSLVLSNTGLSGDVIKKVTDSIPTLETIVISMNNLQLLPVGIFHHNKQLKKLDLSDNRFSSIPLNLKLLPGIVLLDLRRNSIVSLLRSDLETLEDHFSNAVRFKLLLQGNLLSCTCSTIPFLGWLGANSLVLDKENGYSCRSEEGRASNTDEYKDVEALWRACHGRYYFLSSLVVAMTMVSLYLGVFLGIKHRTHITSKLLELVSPRFRLTERKDCLYDVCLGYADQDWRFVRYTLLKYLEELWGLKTFVHQRDLQQDPMMMSQAMNDSYRILFLITDNYLNHCEMAHNTMKTASFFLTPANPNKVVVLVEAEVRHCVLDYILQVVNEDNIICLSTHINGLLPYEIKETIKTRLLR